MSECFDQFVIDAFADKPFSGNPAAVVPLAEWLNDSLLQAIAAQHNLSETAFMVPIAEAAHESENHTNIVDSQGHASYQIRWFTPLAEVDLCGHATMASAHALHQMTGAERFSFMSRSGLLEVRLIDGWWAMDFPAEVPEPIAMPEVLQKLFNATDLPCLFNQDILLVLESEQAVLDAEPAPQALLELEGRGLIITAPSEQTDFVHRFFAPKVGIDEDPVTGSAFTKLIPYWAQRLGRRQLTGRQVSSRGGFARCELNEQRVSIAGQARLYSRGQIFL